MTRRARRRTVSPPGAPAGRRLAPGLGALTMLVLALLAGPGAVTAGAQAVGDTVVRRGTMRGDLYVAGGHVDVLATVEGDIVAAGGRVALGDRVSSDVLAAGGEVTITGRVDDDVRVAGGLVTVRAAVGGDVTAAGGSVRLSPEASVGGAAFLTGGEIDLRGRVGGRLRAAGATIRLGGEVDGNAELTGRRIEILPGARIRGAVVYRSPAEAVVAPDAQVTGPITRRGGPWPDVRRVAWLVAWIGAVTMLGALMIAGVVLALLFPGATHAAARAVAARPWASLVTGFAVLVATPVAAAVLVATFLGAFLGLALLALYVIWVVAGLAIGATWLGSLGTRLVRRETSRGRVVLSLVAGMVVLAVLQAVPVLGALVAAIVLLLGLGAWSLHAYRAAGGGGPAARGSVAPPPA